MSAARYDIFISYCHRDKEFAAQLDSSLRRYRPPLGSGLQPKRLAVFRDEVDAASTNLSEGLANTLSASRKLVVICSPDAAQSAWVNQEIALFIGARGGENVIPVLIRGFPTHEALASGRPTDASFPPSLSDNLKGEPWSPDFRSREQPSARITKIWPAWCHLLAAIYDVPRAVLEQTERIRRLYRTAAAVALALAISATGWAYMNQRNRAISLDLANRADAVPRNAEPGQGLSLAFQAVETAPTEQALDVLKGKLGSVIREGNASSVVGVASSGSRIALASPYGGPVLYDVASKSLRSLCGFVQPVNSFLFSPDESLLLTVYWDGRLQVFDSASARPLGAARLDATGVGITLPHVFFSPDSKSFVVTTFGKFPELRRLPSAELAATLEGVVNKRVLFNASNGTFATYSEDSQASDVDIWSTISGARVWSGGSFNYVAFPASGKRLIARDPGKTSDRVGSFVSAELDASGKPKDLTRIEANAMDLGGLAREGGPSFDPTAFRWDLEAQAVARRPDILKMYGRDAPSLKGGLVRVLEFERAVLGSSGETAFVTMRNSPKPVSLLLSLPDLTTTLTLLDSLKGTPIYSRDGSLLAMRTDAEGGNSSSGKLSMISIKDRREIWSAPLDHVDARYSSDGPHFDGRFSPDGSRFAVWGGHGGGTVVSVYDARTGAELARLAPDATRTESAPPGESEFIELLFIDEGGHRVISRTRHTVYAWDVDYKSQLVALNFFAKQQPQQKTDLDALSKDSKAAVLTAMARRYLNECPDN